MRFGLCPASHSDHLNTAQLLVFFFFEISQFPLFSKGVRQLRTRWLWRGACVRKSLKHYHIQNCLFRLLTFCASQQDKTARVTMTPQFFSKIPNSVARVNFTQRILTTTWFSRTELAWWSCFFRVPLSGPVLFGFRHPSTWRGCLPRLSGGRWECLGEEEEERSSVAPSKSGQGLSTVAPRCKGLLCPCCQGSFSS